MREVSECVRESMLLVIYTRRKKKHRERDKERDRELAKYGKWKRKREIWGAKLVLIAQPC